jgi:hypothetical protein
MPVDFTVSVWLSARDVSIISERILMDFNAGTFILTCRHGPVLVKVGLQFWTLLQDPFACVPAA